MYMNYYLGAVISVNIVSLVDKWHTVCGVYMYNI